MGHPVIDEFCRVFALNQLQPQAFRRMQRVLRDEVQPMLDERERLLAENAKLKEQVRIKLTDPKTPQSEPECADVVFGDRPFVATGTSGAGRRPGRPRKAVTA